jgi:hypothetical protein|tara:strand:+ start:694 stop:1005 length:312 start_codon:yes stop_codon:yes gene_type:complete
MIVRFELTMPNVGSWKGVDTGKKAGCFIFKNLPKKQADELDGKYFYYDFEDGWGAGVKVQKARRSKTEGFRGYDWMVSEILEYGTILKRSERYKLRDAGTYKF